VWETAVRVLDVFAFSVIRLELDPTIAGSVSSGGLSRISGHIGGCDCFVGDSANQRPCPQPIVTDSFPDDPTDNG
jgi:hypothetical protein